MRTQREAIVAAIAKHSAVVIVGETGCGKSTQCVLCCVLRGVCA
jgi:HrpA-like RNA helicase